MQSCLGTGIDKVARLKQHQRTADVSLCCWVSENTVGVSQPDLRVLLLLLPCNVDASGGEGG